MDVPVSTITRPIISKLIALQSFFFARPRIDVDVIIDTRKMYGKRSFGISAYQDHPEPIPAHLAKYNLEFYWNYKLRIKNNSSKTAYNIKIEEIYKKPPDYLEKIDELVSLKEGEIVELDYKLTHRQAMAGHESSGFLCSFPRHLPELKIVVSYTNEGRKRFFTRFIATKDSKTNEHLLRKPKF